MKFNSSISLKYSYFPYDVLFLIFYFLQEEKSMRIDKDIFPFFDSVGKPISAAGTSVPYRNVGGYDSMTLEVSGSSAISMKIQGCVNILKQDKMTPKTDEECSWTDLAVIDQKDYSLKKTIVANGIYAFGISGMAKIRVVVESVTGNTTIVGVAAV